MSNSIFVIYSKKDNDYVLDFKTCLEKEQLELDFSFENIEDTDILEKKIDDSSAILLLVSDAFREDDFVNQAVKYAHDINKTFIAMGNHSGGFFNKQSWLKNEMDVNTIVYGYKSAEQLGEVLAEVRSILGVAVAMGDRVGCLITFDLDSSCSVYANGKLLFAKDPGTYDYRLKAGHYDICFVSEKIKGTEVLNTKVDAKTNDTIHFDYSIRNEEINYLNNVIASSTASISHYENEYLNCNNAIADGNNQIAYLSQRLNESAPTLAPAKASTGSMILFILIYAGIGFMIAVFVGAIIGIFVGRYLAEKNAESKREKKLKNLLNDYHSRMAQYRNERSNLQNKVNEYNRSLKEIEKSIEKLEQNIKNAKDLLNLF